MITNFLLKITTKENTNYKDREVRGKIGLLSGIVGIVINSLLFLLKLTVGIIVSSVAVIADAFNNLSDAASSVITIVGFKMANKPADKNHPYGHGRIEYISALIISFLVLLVGFQFVKTSIGRILKPEAVSFDWLSFTLLMVSILFKLWLSIFNKKLSKKIDSSSLKATSTDALGDVFITLVVALSLLASLFTSFPVDGYIGLGVSLFIIYAAYGLIKETVNPLIGEAPCETLAKNIQDSLTSYNYISGTHDLIIHNYGPGRIMASVHAEIPSNIDVMTIHEVIDKAEREISLKYDLHLVIHMDPICVDNEEIVNVRNEVNKIIKYNPFIKSMHDFRMVGKGDTKNLIFDVVVDTILLEKVSSEEDLKKDIERCIKDINPNYNCIVTIDQDY